MSSTLTPAYAEVSMCTHQSHPHTLLLTSERRVSRPIQPIAPTHQSRLRRCTDLLRLSPLLYQRQLSLSINSTRFKPHWDHQQLSQWRLFLPTLDSKPGTRIPLTRRLPALECLQPWYRVAPCCPSAATATCEILSKPSWAQDLALTGC